ncbi:hypothetical protein TNCV_3077671 [Trichonephila clavipes]|nr:hypothetical protein TNCV_3077671 [Trichonephila clavipes]
MHLRHLPSIASEDVSLLESLPLSILLAKRKKERGGGIPSMNDIGQPTAPPAMGGIRVCGHTPRTSGVPLLHPRCSEYSFSLSLFSDGRNLVNSTVFVE